MNRNLQYLLAFVVFFAAVLVLSVRATGSMIDFGMLAASVLPATLLVIVVRSLGINEFSRLSLGVTGLVGIVGYFASLQEAGYALATCIMIGATLITWFLVNLLYMRWLGVRYR